MPPIHFWITGVLLLLLPAVCYRTRLRIEVPSYLPGFMLTWALQSVVWAGVLYQLGCAGAWREVKEGWQRFLIAAGVPVLLMAVLGVHPQLILVCMAGLTVAEFQYRRARWSRVGSALLPWLYLALGIQLAMVYNCAIVSVRYFNLYDAMFERADALLFGLSVTKVGHAGAFLAGPAEMIYYAMGGVMGAGLLFLCLAGDRAAAFRMAGTIVLAYYISLAIFVAWPSHGPYALHATDLPVGTLTARTQHLAQVNARALYHHSGWMPPAVGYFVAFPSMHVAQPLITAVFLSRWKRVSWILYLYCALLAAAIVILQWHYVVDVAAGIVVAGFAFLLVNRRARARQNECSGFEKELTA